MSVVLSSYMPTDVYGKYQFYIASFFLVGSLSLTASKNTLLKYAAIGHEWSYGIIFSYRLWYALLGSLTLVAWFFLGTSGAHIWYFFVFALLLPLLNCCDLFEYLLEANTC